MLNQNDDQPKNWGPYIVGTVATAILSTVGAKLAEWWVDELRNRYGSKKEKKDEQQKAVQEGRGNRSTDEENRLHGSDGRRIR